MTRKALLQYLVDVITRIKRRHPIRVAIDGVDASGKTTLANELGEYLRSQGEKVIRASIDGFHHPRSIRYRQGRFSEKGYYEDSFNIETVIESLLNPLGGDGARKYKTEVFDYQTDRAVESPLRTAPKDTILIMDGIFLLRPELRDYWDVTVFLDAEFEVSIERALQRADLNEPSQEQELRRLYQKRYVPAQKLYFRDARPKEQADIIVDNNDVENPQITKSLS